MSTCATSQVLHENRVITTININFIVSRFICFALAQENPDSHSRNDGIASHLVSEEGHDMQTEGSPVTRD
mgnify:CR=1 FL=1